MSLYLLDAYISEERPSASAALFALIVNPHDPLDYVLQIGGAVFSVDHDCERILALFHSHIDRTSGSEIAAVHRQNRAAENSHLRNQVIAWSAVFAHGSTGSIAAHLASKT